MDRTRVKVCGITCVEDAMASVDAGADAVGFMFYEASPRHIPDGLVAEICLQMPPWVSRVGVFVNAAPASILARVQQCGLDTVQLHGDEPPEICQQLGRVKVIKAFRVRDASVLETLPHYVTDGWLLDGYVPDRRGGTGARFNWDLALEASRLGRPIIVAGGLTPENAGDAVRAASPYALDVSSGVESAPGKKDADRIRRFIGAVREADRARAGAG